jgi:hypothetical protein
MKALIYIIVFLISTNSYSQDYKDDISVVQFSAPFTQKSEVSLKQFGDHNIHTLCITKEKKFFDEEKIIYLPTIVLYHNGEEILRIESGISLKLPENTLSKLEDEIEIIIESKF